MSAVIFCQLFFLCSLICSVIGPSSAQSCSIYERPVRCIDRCQRCEYKNKRCSQGAVCTLGCDCIPGFLRNQQNQCIPAGLCPVIGPSPAQNCSIYERPVACIDHCQRCEFRDKPCFQPAVCTPGCDCIPGFLRNQQNQCIPAGLCPGSCGENEVYSDCVVPCNDCETRGQCQFLVCNKGCDCKKGYRRQQGKCIPESQCPPRPPQCPPDEIPVPCKDRCQRCEYQNGGCAQIQVCEPGCNCYPGFLRNKQNKCIPASWCPRPSPNSQCPSNEYPVECIDRCQRCEYKNGGCVQIQSCEAGCNCFPGFLRNKQNQCIPAGWCP